MTKENASAAIAWLSLRIQNASGKQSIRFPAEWFPETGLVVYDDFGILIAVTTLYLEKSSPVAVCGWCVTNPENSPAISKSAIKLTMAAMPIYAKNQGARHLLTTFGNRGINRILDELGFVTGDVEVQHKYRML